MERSVPIPTLHLIPVLDELLVDLLRSLSPEDWNRPTLARQWTVKDIAAHLLDTSMRFASLADGHAIVPNRPIDSYQDLVDYLNELNATWVNAMKRVSPNQLIKMIERSNPDAFSYYASLDPFAPAMYSVAWAGEDLSANWFHIARDYTEKWHHQQQIRDAVGKTGPLMTRELFHPCIDTFMQGLPHTYRDVDAEIGTTLKVNIAGEAGGEWFLVKQPQKWVLNPIADTQPRASAILKPDIAWKLFTKGIGPDIAVNESIITGDKQFAERLFFMISVMA